jgi:hypothetical protein
MKKDNELIVNAIRGLLADMKKDTSLAGSSQPNGSIRDKLKRLLESTEDESSSDTVAEPLKLCRPELRLSPDVPYDDSSDPVTVNQLIGLLEAALEPKGSLDLSASESAGAEQAGGITSHGQCSPTHDVPKH